MEELSARQKLFCEEYVKDYNGTKAAIRAGYAENGAEVSASRLLRLAKVNTYLKELQAIRAEQTKVDQAWVLEKFQEIARASLTPNDKGKIDAHGAARALENIAKHLGFYEKDNSQLNKPTNIKIEIVEPKDE